VTDEDAAFTEELVTLAYQVERGAREDHVATLEALDRVRKIADSARGTRRALAEVAEAFLRAMSHGHGGQDAFAVHRFIREYQDGGVRVLDQSTSAAGAVVGDGLKSTPTFRALVDLGVLIAVESEENRYRVSPRSRPLVRDAVAPLHFRSWRAVQEARAEAAMLRSEPERILALCGALGCTVVEALVHLRTFPIEP